MEVNRIVGGVLCSTFGVRADMMHPDVTVYIEIIDGDAVIYTSKTRGACGLPVGVSGTVVGLLSAGFDSPVACWQLIRRGARVMFVHFHSMPYTGRQSVEQVRELAAILTKYQFRSKLYLVPFAPLEQEIVLHSPQPLRVILYRRMMIRVAEEIAGSEGAEALVTGEAVGQVASQTLRNIRVINDVAHLPILRPLAGMDKEGTMAMAREIGTYDVSKEPFDDCCSFLAPRRPETWASPASVREAESALNIAELVRGTVGQAEVESFVSPSTEIPEPAGP
jgi:thiamine biosynthesis protein ThiI